jgi:hypothetical protein
MRVLISKNEGTVGFYISSSEETILGNIKVLCLEDALDEAKGMSMAIESLTGKKSEIFFDKEVIR